MTEKTVLWMDDSSHWKASGKLQSNGSLTSATVIDNHGTTRTRDATFSSESDFKSWVRRHTN